MVYDEVNNILNDQQLESKPTYLGFDFSTQQLKAIAIDDSLEIIHQAIVQFDSDLPEFRTHGGANKREGGNEVTAPPLMWVKALDMVLERLKISGLDFGTVQSISGTGQQHGSVYWRKGSREKLKNLNSAKFLHHELQDAFALRDSPIWMDSSTTEQCNALEKALGGPEKLAAITGSRAYERFTGSQIAKIASTRPEVYNSTERISLVSSFAASLFLGDYAPIDLSDGSGMNLLDIWSGKWSQICLDAIAPELRTKLGDEVVPTATVVGKISSYYVDRYGFPEKTSIVAFTGDNPASLVGMVLDEGDIGVSLGTSDTVFLSLRNPKPTVNWHILVNPINPSDHMALLCFKNGSLTRERIRNETAEGSWTIFNELIESTPRGNFGNIGFYFDCTEVYPLVKGDFRFNKFNERVARLSKEVEARACIEGQFLRLRLHAASLGYTEITDSCIKVTGGASANKTLLQILSDVFNKPVYRQTMANSASYGTALMAKYALIGDKISFKEMTSSLKMFSLVCVPSKDAHSIYTPMVERYKILEEKIKSESEQ
ncbi:xylulose kinase-like [Panonychus citri]|uniref:xylulose kinase-like n=1 Tax=Panonychus citri TaxID=50023 RepID=UPI002307F022|nr:xylulose kinase-like [Panonychus citri]